jgi:hypothetical protein
MINQIRKLLLYLILSFIYFVFVVHLFFNKSQFEL